jgi:hypothetical protein
LSTAASITSVLHGIGSDQRAHHRIGARQGPSDGPIVTVEFGLIVGQDDNGAASFATAFALDIVRGVEHGAGDICSAIEALLAKQAVKFLPHRLRAAVERQSHTRGSIEDHDAHPVFFAEHSQRLPGRIGNALHVRPHAGAHIQQKEYIHGHVFAGEAANGHLAAILAENEVPSSQVSDGAIAGVDYLGVDPNQRHITAKNGFVVPQECGFEDTREQQNSNSSSHGFLREPSENPLE